MKTRKHWVTKRIAKGMYDLSEIFKERKNIPLGLKRDEVISYFYSIPLKKISKLRKDTIDSKWTTIKTIKKYLFKSKQMAVIFVKAEKGIDLYDERLGRRTLTRRTNIFFRCSKMEDALGFRDRMDKIGNSIKQIGDDTIEIVEEELEQKPILETIKVRQ